MNKKIIRFLLLTILLVFISILTLLKPSSASILRSGVTHVDTVSGQWQHKSFYAEGRYWAFYYVITGEFSGIEVSSSLNATTWDFCCNLEDEVYQDGRYFSLDFNGTHFAYVERVSSDLKFRMGNPNSDGTISWVSTLQTIPTGGSYPAQNCPVISLDANGYAWVGATNMSGFNPWVFKNNKTDGTWTTDFSYKLSTTNDYWILQLNPLSNGQMYVTYGMECKGHFGQLWNGASFGSEETIQPSGSQSYSAYSSIPDGNNVVYVFTNGTSPWACYSTIRTFGVGWGSKQLVYAGYVEPILAYSTTERYICTWVLTLNPVRIVYKQYEAGTWDSNYTILYYNASEIMSCGQYALSGWDTIWNNEMAVMFFLSTPTDTLRFEHKNIVAPFIFHGVYDEDTGELKSPNERACNITAYFTNQESEMFELNGTYNYNPIYQPLYFSMNTSVNRQYWLAEGENNATIYVYDTSLTAYIISFLDLAGVLDSNPIITASRYIGGSLTVVERRKVDIESKVVMALKNGERYTITVSGESTWTFGDLAMTGITTVQLTLKGIDFSKETLMTSKYVRIYGLREFDTPTGTIAITYQDLLNMTTSVKIYINYKNGTNVYYSLQTSDSFNHEWSNALNNTDYAVNCTITHERYGTYTWKNYYPCTHSDMPFGLDFLGKSLPFNTAYIIPAFIILFAGGCFSALNKIVGAFSMVIMAALLSYMGWIPIPGPVLIVAFALVVLMGIVSAKRRIET